MQNTAPASNSNQKYFPSHGLIPAVQMKVGLGAVETQGFRQGVASIVSLPHGIQAAATNTCNCVYRLGLFHQRCEVKNLLFVYAHPVCQVQWV